MALGAPSAQQGPPGRSLCQPQQARIYRSLPSTAEASRGEPSPAQLPGRSGPWGAPARPLRVRRSYCIRRRAAPRFANPEKCPQQRLRGSQGSAALPPDQCATRPRTQRVLKHRRAPPALGKGSRGRALGATGGRMMRVRGRGGRDGTHKKALSLSAVSPSARFCETHTEAGVRRGSEGAEEMRDKCM